MLQHLKDYGIWLLAVFARGVMVFVFNTVKRRNIVENGLLKSRRRPPPQDNVKGSWYQMLEKAAQQSLSSNGNRTLLRDYLSGKELKASEALCLTKRLSVALSSKGFQKGDKLHIFTNNNIYYQTLMMAVWRLGGIVSCGDTALKADTIGYQLKEIQAKFVVCDPETEEEIKKALNELESVCLLAIGRVDGCDDLIALADEAVEDDAPIPVDMEDADECVIILWSSGTTGKPKGILHSHQTMWNMLSDGKRAAPSAHGLMTLHFFHIGSFFTFQCLVGGHTATFLHGKGLTLVALLEAVKRCRPSFLILGSHHYVQLSEFDLSSTKVSSNDLNSVKAIVANGSAVPPICKHKLRKIFPLSALHLHGYGQTETYVFTVGLMEYNGLGAIDPRATLKVVNPDTGEICKPLEHGEIRAKSNMLMIGYLNRPKSDFFDDEGFGMTGDLGYYDEDGVLYYVDRIKELVKYCNNHVAPTELEDILQTHPAVAESLVFGIKEPSVQELISAVIVLRDDAKSVSEEDIRNFVNGKVNADFKKIRGRVLFRKSVPRNTSGKLLRREMRLWAQEEAARETV